MKTEAVATFLVVAVLMIVVSFAWFQAGYQTRDNEVKMEACTTSGNQWEPSEDICVTPYEVVEP